MALRMALGKQMHLTSSELSFMRAWAFVTAELLTCERYVLWFYVSTADARHLSQVDKQVMNNQETGAQYHHDLWYMIKQSPDSTLKIKIEGSGSWRCS